MPYFHNQTIHLLFIHIPRTGGTSIEHYFSGKYQIPLDIKSMYSNPTEIKREGVTYQHLTFPMITDAIEKWHPDFMDVSLSNVVYMTSVRNPYHRVFSNLFFYGLMSSQSNLEQVFYIIKDRFLPHNLHFDNHVLPQHEFVAGIPRDQLKIVRLETIREDMRALGYADFDLDLCKSYHIKEYHEFFSKETVELINAFYAEDFDRFGYERLDPANFPSFTT
jgi:hypothetical protein